MDILVRCGTPVSPHHHGSIKGKRNPKRITKTQIEIAWHDLLWIEAQEDCHSPEKQGNRQIVQVMHRRSMKIKFTHWTENDGKFLGYLNDFPDHWTQGETLDDLKEHLRDLHDLFKGDPIPGIRKVGELEVEAA